MNNLTFVVPIHVCLPRETSSLRGWGWGWDNPIYIIFYLVGFVSLDRVSQVAMEVWFIILSIF